MNRKNIFPLTLLNEPPIAFAHLYGSTTYPEISGIVNFYPSNTAPGLLIEAEFNNLPNTTSYSPRFMGLHIHENGDCSASFENTGAHYNPTGANHPYHLGDLLPVFNSNGYSYFLFFNSFLTPEDIMNRSVILHSNRDDFTSQPAGDSGIKIACGVIIRSGETDVSSASVGAKLL